ncbi:chromosome segregation protein SMC [Salinicoccus halitifaciens]|uniref:Chromosome partition protein Smc n=1 Tax=Salinicoccus halitifaciens TaxID=1073415 RepID=A0ABV2E796_9STAP|nr:chromosome segregation protein SMC [Salinicoccus halitifaciens]MCD2136640.1 chromosome segregation protein SMC [Salinicoccus halitifaciens]
MVYLKSIEANGFKSFANKVDVSFDSGLTAVVGPNGSGKSNITDAIRWVLGEQSAKTIRGVKMEDVIFSGTDSRKPMNSASVKLTLDNGARGLAVDADEVSITRKLYRNGDSEYFINDERVRLKEITELFLDSGLGRNAYNIISQGEVDTLLKARPDERRTLIEEVAGVMKYKIRRKESEKRLQDTKDNLNRVNDIIRELSGRVEKLEVESANAGEYLALKEEMKKADIEVTIYDINHLLKKLEEENARIGEAEKLLKRHQSETAALDEKLADLSAARDGEDANSKTINRKIVETSKKLEQLNGKIALFEERKSNKGQLKEELSSRLDKAVAEKEEHETMLSGINEELAEYRTAIKDLRESLKETEEKRAYLSRDHTGEIEKLKDQYYALMVEKTTLENEQKRTEEMLKDQHSLFSQQKARAGTLEKEVSEYESRLEEKQAELSESAEALTSLRSEYKEKKRQREDVYASYLEEKDKYEKSLTYYEKQKSRLDMLKSIQNEYRGYFPGVRAVLQNGGSLEGVIGAVGELIGSEPKYVTALDTALGAASQNIVMRSEADAKEAIGFLKRLKRGFATFLPLDVIKKRSLSDSVLNTLRNSTVEAQVLAEAVDIKPEYENVIWHLLGTTVVVENIDDAGIIARETGHRVKIVTLDGETVFPGGAMSGGSRQSKGSVLETKSEIDEIGKKLKSHETLIAAQKEKVDGLSGKITDMDMEISGLEEAGTAESDRHDELRQLASSLDYQLSSRKETLRMIEEELSSRTDEHDSADFEEQIRNKEIELEQLDERIRLISASEKDKKTELETLADEYNAVQNELTRANERYNYKKSEHARITEALDAIAASIDEIKNEQEIISLDLTTLDVKALREEKETLAQTLEQLYGEADELSELQYSLKSEYQEAGRQREEIYRQSEALQDTLRSATGTKEKLDARLEQKLEYLSENYRTTYERESGQFTEFKDIEDKRLQINLNKKSIEELGPVNLGAIDEYAVVNERYTFLKDQEADLLEARETLLEVIAEMDDTVAERFKDAFHEVDRRFGEVFREMFGGGLAELRLTEPDDYLNSGIEIYAQPPGKKLSSLSLLSGGERALTAISLLFSMLKVRISPFIILDEVEAALDEANVVRYAQYLKKLSMDMQFIVITHRKGTMEEADRLFGVTMQERGVSQLISVDLKDYEEAKV